MTTSRRLLVLTHVAHEGPGLLFTALDGVPFTTRTVIGTPDPPLPDVADLAGLVVMGGPQDADDDAGNPGLAAERRLLAAAVDAGVPVLGVCLGMQLLAMALGAPLHRRAGTEIGFGPVDVVAPDPVLDPLGARPQVLHWHSDAVDLPSGATLLASSEVTPVQAFRAGSALGLQFHVEADRALVDLWLHTPVMTDPLDPGEVERVAADAAEVLPVLTPGALLGLGAFADAVRART
ncbi:type 1 glutamine amidotransferase [Cellulomonas hominis]